MASKTVKKKAPAKTAESTVKSSAAKAASAAQAKTASVIPFGPLSGMTNTDFSNFNQSLPAFSGTFESMETTMNNFKSQYEKMTCDASSSMRESVECMTKSTSSLTKGAEQMMKTIMQVAQESSQRNAEAMKAMMACRTMNEFAEAQNKMAQQNFDDAMSTMTKLSEMTIKLCTEALEPINGQMTKAMSGAMASASAMKKNAA